MIYALFFHVCVIYTQVLFIYNFFSKKLKKYRWPNTATLKSQKDKQIWVALRVHTEQKQKTHQEKIKYVCNLSNTNIVNSYNVCDFDLYFQVTSTVCSNPNKQGMQNKKMQTLFKDIVKTAEDVEEYNKKYFWLCSISKIVSSLELNIICLGQNKLLSRNLKSIILTISVWQNRRRPQTYKFKSYLSMCFWQIVTLHVYVVQTLIKADLLWGNKLFIWNF